MAKRLTFLGGSNGKQAQARGLINAYYLWTNLLYTFFFGCQQNFIMKKLGDIAFVVLEAVADCAMCLAMKSAGAAEIMDVAAVAIAGIHAAKYSEEKDRVFSEISKTQRTVSTIVPKKDACLGGGTNPKFNIWKCTSYFMNPGSLQDLLSLKRMKSHE